MVNTYLTPVGFWGVSCDTEHTRNQICIYIYIYIIFIILGYRYQWLPYSSMHFHIGFMCFMFTQFVSFLVCQHSLNHYYKHSSFIPGILRAVIYGRFKRAKPKIAQVPGDSTFFGSKDWFFHRHFVSQSSNTVRTVYVWKTMAPAHLQH